MSTDPGTASAQASDAAVASQRLAEAIAALSAAQSDFCARSLRDFASVPGFEALFRALVVSLAADPQRLSALQSRYYAEQLALWREFAAPGAQPSASIEEAARDPRFRAPEWRELPWFAYLHRSYEIASAWLRDLISSLQTDASTQRKLAFYAQQFIDAAAPSNFVATNPEALKTAIESGGESLARGLRNLLDDAAKGRVSMSDERAFEVGRNIGITPGAVVYRNELFELLQYQPIQAQVHRRALLIVPPCINKYYILDLRPQNSFVRYALENALNVFIVSWRNIPPSLGGLDWDAYIEQGVARAIDVTRAISGQPKLNTLGFCVGGTLLAATLAVLHRKRSRPAASLTLLASLLDFAEPGEIGVYIDEPYVSGCERELAAGGIMPGSRLAAAFASLRANDLIWRYVVDSYLKGESPAPFDLLYWNGDSANLPGPMYAYYLRNMYLGNALREPEALTMCGVPVDLGRIDLPSYILATEGDHIVPWHSAYASARLLGEDVTFVLGGSGHIAGVVNPPQAARRHYRTGAFGADPQAWLTASRTHTGSWWPHWARWIGKRSGALAPAPERLGNERYPVLGAAPGSYVCESPQASASA